MPAQHQPSSPQIVEQKAATDAAPGEPPVQTETVRPDCDPRIVELVQPSFSKEQQALPSGEVVVMVQIDQAGKPVRTMIAKSTNAAFNQPIVTAVLRSTFAPGLTASVPAVKWLTIPFRVN